MHHFFYPIVVFPFMIFSFLSLCWFSFCFRVCACTVASVSVWWGLRAEALVVQKSGSSSVLAEGKTESCGKMLLQEWPVWQLLLYVPETLVWNCHEVFVSSKVTRIQFCCFSKFPIWVTCLSEDVMGKSSLNENNLSLSISAAVKCYVLFIGIDFKAQSDISKTVFRKKSITFNPEFVIKISLFVPSV